MVNQVRGIVVIQNQVADRTPFQLHVSIYQETKQELTVINGRNQTLTTQSKKQHDDESYRRESFELKCRILQRNINARRREEENVL